ncbi:pyridoxamine 5'-phosphate oxidase family protein [Ilumatobacter nonamiensis]|uniref:pyridoxamine 5'-phosphate oxidase family protein n=1 Tax=Ilumatobacter nonamiensis TaxID=467093 RepID=UPI00034C0A5B|nr:pyridoxamine 5'-phosphate oxidase family protein [Ilumatobacter nonamiensis]
MSPLSVTAPAFVDMAHRIVWATVATISPSGQPRTRVLHPIWEWDGDRLHGWIGTFPHSPKAADLAHDSRVSVTYWSPEQDTCTADCDSVWETSPDERSAAWDRFARGPEPVGYDPAMIPGWTSAESPEFGVLRLEPTRLRVFPGTMLLQGTGDVLTWSA